MKIERTNQSENSVVVETTAATFLLNANGLDVTTKIPGNIKVAVLELEEIGPWRIESRDDDEVTLRRSGQELIIASDGFITLQSDSGSFVQLHEKFDVQCLQKNDQALVLRTREFGCGIFRQAEGGVDRGKVGVGKGQPLFFHVFPPRRADITKFAMQIAHEGRPSLGQRYPSELLIEDIAKHADVFALHAYFWREEEKKHRPKFSRYRFRPCPWFSAKHIPDDRVAFERVREKVKEQGMLFVPYVSPRYSKAPNILKELGRLLELYQFDGFYLDGLRGDFVEQRQFVRQLRQLLGPDRLIYLNGTDQPFGSPRITAPFIDTHCDFVLRGDSGRGGLGVHEFLKWCVSGVGGGNQVGVWCHYGSSGWPFPFDRVPSATHQLAAYSAQVQIWRRSFWWPGKKALARFDAIARQRKES